MRISLKVPYQPAGQFQNYLLLFTGITPEQRATIAFVQLAQVENDLHQITYLAARDPHFRVEDNNQFSVGFQLGSAAVSIILNQENTFDQGKKEAEPENEAVELVDLVVTLHSFQKCCEHFPHLQLTLLAR